MFHYAHSLLRLISIITPTRIGRFFYVLITEGAGGISKRIDRHIPELRVSEYTPKINLIDNYKEPKAIKDYKEIVFTKENEPLVSIIIPVHNQFKYTYNCLKSIYDYTGKKVSYEIIIANDSSSDLTTKINQIISNIEVVSTLTHFGFLKNCNHAAKYAKGKYIFFLNNDTQVQENWLQPLIELIESDNTIGAVGSKLVFKNSRLQEAGGVVWNDAFAWNYGRMCHPALPEFNYVKEVDYISGAALMIKKPLWEKLGGFDERFIPAYYEDTDLCLSIRKIGYKVMYQPASVVVHFEGMSNGTDISKGQKQYQGLNKVNFFNKWKDVLEKEHFPNGETIFHARDRSGNKKTLLMVDRYVPHFDKDAGSRAALHFLKLFISFGFNVKFIGDDFCKHEPYTATLEQMGIEVLYGNYYFKNWKTWLRTNGQYIDFVVLSRPYISIKYIDVVRKYTQAKVFYYGHDLHFLRDSREYALTNAKEKLKSSEKWKKLEISIMEKSDVVYYFSAIEVDIIKEINSSINCKIVPLNIFPSTSLQVYNSDRKDLIFVGGFSHSPNIDAVVWFANNIMPIVRKAIPGVVLNVIGSDVPDEIKKLEREDIKILGYLDDNILDEYYKNCKICIIPLRYGAGVKGKLLEAMYKQIPVITTTIGAEGLPNITECLLMEDNPNKFAETLVSMYNNNELLKNLTEKSYLYIMKYFTSENVINIFKKDFDIDIH